MSVSMQDNPACASSTPDHAHGNASAGNQARPSAPVMPEARHTHAANVSFHTHNAQSGPVFGGQPTATDPHSHAYQPHYDAPLTPRFMHQLKHLLAHLFGGHRPQRPDFANPYPIAPGRPDPQYSSKSPNELTRQLRNNFSAFLDPKTPGFASPASIYAMAIKGRSADPVMNENIRLANELLRRPDLIKAVDRQGATGALDGRISLQDLNAIISSNDPFKYTTDKQLAAEMDHHFDLLNGGRTGQELSFSDLRTMAKLSLTGNAAQNHLIQLAKEALKRGEVLRTMDNLNGRANDGRINREALRRLSI